MKGNNILSEAERNKLYLRTADENDMDLLFQWANDPDVRKNSFHSEPISYETHKKWFAEHLKDICEIQYILMEGTEPVGQIRFSANIESVETDYSIKPSKRGKGYGKKILSLAIKKLRSEHPEIRYVIAKVKSENTVSAHCFEKNEFRETFRQFELRVKD